MPAMFVACYPRPEDGKYRFDLDYYLKIHMPLQLKHHGPHGMRSYHVIEGTPDCPFVVNTIEFWDSVEGMQDAIANYSAELWEDIPKYTDIPNPFSINGTIKGHWVDSSLDITYPKK